MSAVIQNQGNLRPMLVDDIDEVMTIEKAVYDFPWTAGIFRDCLRVGYSCWVYHEGLDLKAYGVMSVAVGEAHILTVCVRPEDQGKGYGRMILEHLLELAAKRHANKMFLEVRPSNQVAVNLYKSLGFEEIGARKDYYPAEQGREDALVMVRELP